MRTRLFFTLLMALGFMAQAAKKPNVLFLICDDLNCDMSTFGHPMVKTPNMDKLAKRGVTFDRAYCQYPLCGPSRASFMTGLYPDQNLIKRNAIYIREHVPSVRTLSQMYRDNGYFATRIGKIYHYNVPKQMGTGGHDDPYSWDQTINPRGRDKDEEDKIFSLKPGSFGATLSWLAADGTDEEQTDGIAATEADKMLKRFAKNDTPFFLAVGLFRPHTPFVAPKKYFDMYPLDKIKVPTVPEGYHKTLPAPAVKSISRRKEERNISDEHARKSIQAYYASITFADAQLGRILESLKESGLEDDTIVLFTSDHGYHMGEHGHWQKTTLFEASDRVPLIMAGPGITEKGKRTTMPVEMVDFYPTLADLSGLKAPSYISGTSLAPALKNIKARPRQNALTQYSNGYSVRTQRYRYTEWGEKGKEGNELYDHSKDPQEMNNLASDPSQKATITKLSKLLRQRISEAQTPPKGVQRITFENNRRVKQ